MADDLILAKAEIIERCLQRVREEYANEPVGLRTNFTRQDSILLNLERACQAAIDLALHLVRVRRLGLPKETREAFELLGHAGLIRPEMLTKLKAMVGFRNVAVHQYQSLDVDIVQSIVEREMFILNDFSRLALKDFAA